MVVHWSFKVLYVHDWASFYFVFGSGKEINFVFLANCCSFFFFPLSTRKRTKRFETAWSMHMFSFDVHANTAKLHFQTFSLLRAFSKSYVFSDRFHWIGVYERQKLERLRFQTNTDTCEWALTIRMFFIREVPHQLQQVQHAVPAMSSTARQMTCVSTPTGSVMEKRIAQMVLMSSSVHPLQHSPRLLQDHLILQTATLKKTCACGSLPHLQIWSGHGIAARHPAIRQVQMAIIHQA